MKEIIIQLQQQLDNVAIPKTKDWWERYMKHVIPFRGVRMQDIKKQLHDVLQKNDIFNLTDKEQLAVALALFSENYAEDKLAGILYLQQHLYDRFECDFILSEYELLFQKELIFDWNICDWFCVRVLGPTIEKNGRACAERIADWSNAQNLWQARCSVVAFVYIAANAEYHPLIKHSCQILIKRPERFAKTGVGWMLREMSKINSKFVLDFLDEELAHLTTESLRNSIKYFEKDRQIFYIQHLKNRQ
jgi:3-methyladenine DNA glycosylase AlkD